MTDPYDWVNTFYNDLFRNTIARILVHFVTLVQMMGVGNTGTQLTVGWRYF